MPYIAQDKRNQLDPIVDELHRQLVNLKLDDETTNTEGCINYAITRLLMMVYGDKDSTSYRCINDALGVLDGISKEYYRKVAAPYEDQKEFENGQVDISHEPEVVGSVNVVDTE
jgi:hypothetical protein